MNSFKEKVLRRKSKRVVSEDTNGDIGASDQNAGEKASITERPFTPMGPTRISIENSAFHVSSGTRRPESRDPHPRPSTGPAPKPIEPVANQHRRVVSLEERKPRAEDAVPMRISSKHGVQSTTDPARISSSFDSKPESASYTLNTIGSSTHSYGRGSLERQENVVEEIIPKRASSKHIITNSPVSTQAFDRTGLTNGFPYAMTEDDPRTDRVPGRSSSLHFVHDGPLSRTTTTITTTTTTSPTATTTSSPTSPTITTMSGPIISTTTTTTTPPSKPKSRGDWVIIEDGEPGPSHRDPRSRKPLPNSAKRLPELDIGAKTRRGSNPSAQLANLNLQRTKESHDSTMGSSVDSAPLLTNKDLPPVPPIPPTHSKDTAPIESKYIAPTEIKEVTPTGIKDTAPVRIRDIAPIENKTEIPEHLRLPPGFNLQNTEQTHVSEEWRPAVTHENILKQRTEIIQEEITRDIHMHHYFTYLQPIKVVEILPPKHFLLDPETGVKTEIPAPSGWALPASMQPVSPDASMLKTWTRHYLVNEEHPLGLPELPPLKHEPAFDNLRQEAKDGEL